ncbi:MAG: DUF6279 family lipoprotein [Myxococcota bacterium]
MKRLLLYAVAFSLAGCSQISIAYRFADLAIEREFNKFFELSDAQDEELSEFADTYMVWHRGTMLRQYRELLSEEAKIHREGRFSRATFDVTRAKAQLLYERTLRPMLPQITTFLVNQSPSQLSAFEKKMRERSKEYREKAKERTPEKGLEQIESTLSDFIGELTGEQRTIIKEKIKPFFSQGTAWIDERDRRADELLTRVRKKDRAAVKQYITAWWLKPLTISPPDYAERSQKNLDRVDDLIYEVLAAMTPEQRNTFIETLDGYAEDIGDLTS